MNKKFNFNNNYNFKNKSNFLLKSIKTIFIILILAISADAFRGTIGFWKKQNTSFAPTFPSNARFRSVGPANTTALATGGSNSLTIANSIATFASGLPNNVGLGDALQYDAANAGTATADAIVFIHERISSTQYYVRTVAGAAAADTVGDQDWALYRAYTSLSNAEAGTENTGILAALRNFDTFSGGKNIVSSTEIWQMVCYADATDSTQLLFSGWTTSTSYYVRIFTPVAVNEVGVTQRHSGVWNSAMFNIALASQYTGVIQISDLNIHIEGLQIDNTYSAGSATLAGIQIKDSSGTWISENIIRHSPAIQGTDAYNGGIDMVSVNTGGPIYFWNNIIDNYVVGIANTYSVAQSGAIYNNTIVNSGSVGIDWSGSAANNNVYLKNNLITGTVSGSDYALLNMEATANNLSEDATSPEAGLRNKTVTFRAAGDYRLSISDLSAAGAGVNLSADSILSFTKDVGGITRTSTWDIGASTVVP